MAGTMLKADPPRGFGTLTADVLDRHSFAPLRFVIPGLLPEGLTILAGKPKFGKSFAMIDMGVAISSGGKAFGSINCTAGDVLYCAFEDGPRRLQTRIRGMLPMGTKIPCRLHLETSALRIGGGLIEALETWLDDHPEARLIILDTWRCIKPETNGRNSLYDEDASALNPLHELAKSHPGLAILVVHHTRKLEADDPFDTISGTNGLTGVADTLMVLCRHGEEGAKLACQGRDIDGYEKALARDKLTGGWRFIGDAQEFAKTAERQSILDTLANTRRPMAAREIADLINEPYDNVRRRLMRMAANSEIRRVGKRGQYACLNSTNCPNSDNDGTDGTAGTGVIDL